MAEPEGLDKDGMKWMGRIILSDDPALNARKLINMLMLREKGGKIEDSTASAFALVSIAERLRDLIPKRSMNFDEARSIIKDLGYWRHEPGEGTMLLDGHFTAIELQAFSVYMEQVTEENQL